MACTNLLKTEYQTDLPAELGNIPFDTPGTNDFYFGLPTANTADRTATFPDASITVAGINLAQTWTEKQTFGDIDVTGTAFFTDAGVISMENETLLLNDHETAIDPTGFAGIEIEMTTTNRQFGFNTSGVLQAGLVGTLYDVFNADLFTAANQFLVSTAADAYGVQDAATARGSLGLDSAAVEPVGTFFQVANNLSEGTDSTMLGNLGLDTSLQDIVFSGPTVDRTLTIPDADLTISTYGASLVDDTDASTARTTLGFAEPILDRREPGDIGQTTAGLIDGTTIVASNRLTTDGFLNMGGIETVTIDGAGDLDISSSGAHLFNVEGAGIVADVMSTITGGADNDEIQLMRDSGEAYAITITHAAGPSTGEIYCTGGEDIVMNNDYHTVSLRKHGVYWVAQAIAPSSGAGYVEKEDFTADGEVLIGTGAGTYESVAILESNNYLKHEYGGIEADISAITTGGILYGGSAGSMDILVAGDNGDVLTLASGIPSWAPAGAPGVHSTAHEIGGADLVDHDNLTNFVADEHIDWTVDMTATKFIDVNNLEAHIGTEAIDITATHITNGFVPLSGGFFGPSDAVMFVNGVMYESGAACFLQMATNVSPYDQIDLISGHPFQDGDRLVIFGLLTEPV